MLMRALDFRKEKSLITYHHPCVYYVSGSRRGDSKMYLVPTHVLGGGGNTTWQILNGMTLSHVWKTLVLRKW